MKPKRNRGRRVAIQAVIFDWDGTLLDSYRADTHASLKMLAALGINWGFEELAQHYSPNEYRVYHAARIPRRQWKEADRLWQWYYGRERPRMARGARSLLRAIKRRYTVAVVTSGSRARVTRQWRRFALDGIFAARVCAEDTPHRKPHPGPLRRALRALELPAEACVYVGDAPEDIQMARRAGVRAVGVLGSFSTHARLRATRPEVLLRTIEDLPAWLAAQEHRSHLRRNR